MSGFCLTKVSCIGCINLQIKWEAMKFLRQFCIGKTLENFKFLGSAACGWWHWCINRRSGFKKATMPRLKAFFKDIGYVSWIRYWVILDKSWLYMFELYKFQTMMGF